MRSTYAGIPFEVVDIISPSKYEGWANIIYTGKDWQGGCVAMVIPSVAEALRKTFLAAAEQGMK